jgi:RNA polymerase sigma-70 factor (ECF subfamily)
MPPPADIQPELEDTRQRDAEWMKRVQSGDPEAFRALILAYQNRIAAALARMAGPAFDPEELAHEVFVRVWKSAHRYEPSARLSTWLLTIARNLFLNELRYRNRHPTVSMDAPRRRGTPLWKARPVPPRCIQMWPSLNANSTRPSIPRSNPFLKISAPPWF